MLKTAAMFFLSSALTAGAILLLKQAGAGLKWPPDWGPSALRGYAFLAVAAGVYVASFAVWTWVLATHPVTIAYPVCLAITLLLTTIASIAIFGERLTLTQGVGIVVLLLGAILVMQPWRPPPAV